MCECVYTKISDHLVSQTVILAIIHWSLLKCALNKYKHLFSSSYLKIVTACKSLACYDTFLPLGSTFFSVSIIFMLKKVTVKAVVSSFTKIVISKKRVVLWLRDNFILSYPIDTKSENLKIRNEYKNFKIKRSVYRFQNFGTLPI